MMEDWSPIVGHPVLGRPLSSICKLAANAIDSVEILIIHSGNIRLGRWGLRSPSAAGQIVPPLSVVHKH